MLSFRYHVASLVAVLLALAAGVALGGGPLKDVGSGSSQDLAAVRTALATQRGRTADLQQQAAMSDRFASAVGPRLVQGRLTGHAVSLVLLPGADPHTVSALTGLIGSAGGHVVATFAVQPKTTSAGNRQLVDALTSQLAAQHQQITVPSTASTYQRLGVLLGRLAGSTTRGGASYDATAVSLLAGLDTAGLVRAVGQPQRRGDLVLVVAGAPTSSSDAQGGPAIEASIATAMAPQVHGVVVAGPTSSAASSGVLQQLRSTAGGDPAGQDAVSTVDSADTGAGQVATVLALAATATGGHGSWGVVGRVSGPMPGVAASGTGAS